jgi:hypothetical protein
MINNQDLPTLGPLVASRADPGKLVLDMDRRAIVPGKLVVALLRPQAAPSPAGDVVCQLELVVLPQLDVVAVELLPLLPGLVVAHVGVVRVEAVLAGVVVVRRGGDPPPASEERAVGRETGADDADEGLAAGPDEDLCHGPGEVLGFDEPVHVDDSHDAGNADAGCLLVLVITLGVFCNTYKAPRRRIPATATFWPFGIWSLRTKPIR